METLSEAIGFIFGILTLAFDLLMVALPFLFLYAIYRVIKGLMTHNAELKARERDRIERDL